MSESTIGCCDACQYITTVRTYSENRDTKQQLCAICASTFIGNTVDYPGQYDSATLHSIAIIANLLIDSLDIRSQFEQAVRRQDELDMMEPDDWNTPPDERTNE